MGSTFWNKRYGYKIGRNRTRRPKTFSSEATAQEWAKKQGISKFRLHNLRINSEKKKLKVIPEI